MYKKPTRYFKSCHDNMVFTGLQLEVFKSIMNMTLDEMVNQRFIEELQEPSVDTIIELNGWKNRTPTIQRYRELNQCTGREATEAIMAMLKEKFPPKQKNDNYKNNKKFNKKPYKKGKRYDTEGV